MRTLILILLFAPPLVGSMTEGDSIAMIYWGLRMKRLIEIDFHGCWFRLGHTILAPSAMLLSSSNTKPDPMCSSISQSNNITNARLTCDALQRQRCTILARKKPRSASSSCKTISKIVSYLLHSRYIICSFLISGLHPVLASMSHPKRIPSRRAIQNG